MTIQCPNKAPMSTVEYCVPGIRVTYNTWLGNAGTAFRVQMELMRHTDPRLTAKTYTDSHMLETAAAVEGLPDLGPLATTEGESALRTGTDDMPTQMPNESIALNRVSECPGGTISGHFGVRRKT